MTLQTQYEFSLPRGYMDAQGKVHKKGVMRLATAMDEIEPLRDIRVRANQAYLTVILLARVVVRLGDLASVSTSVIENLFAGDLAYLQAFYRQINEQGVTQLEITCSACRHKMEVDLAALGESLATP
jgi:hypothetical protein